MNEIYQLEELFNPLNIIELFSMSLMDFQAKTDSLIVGVHDLTNDKRN